MGSDNLFHKRKEQSAKSLARRIKQRKPYDKVLIVCEGEKTESHYFKEIKEHHKISSVMVRSHKPDPKSIVDFAEKLYEKEKGLHDPFDKVFCVFDKDIHSSYDEALNKMRGMTPSKTFVAITSVPCFEYWLLLHYTLSTKPYSGVQVLSALKTHFPDYKKNRTDIFFTLLGKLETAKQNARHVLQEANKTDTDNPSTNVHELVEFLQNIKP